MDFLLKVKKIQTKGLLARQNAGRRIRCIRRALFGPGGFVIPGAAGDLSPAGPEGKPPNPAFCPYRFKDLRPHDLPAPQ